MIFPLLLLLAGCGGTEMGAVVRDLAMFAAADLAMPDAEADGGAPDLAPRVLRLVCAGDSLTAGTAHGNYRCPLARLLTADGYEVHFAGLVQDSTCGAYTAAGGYPIDAIGRLLAASPPVGADFVLLTAGTVNLNTNGEPAGAALMKLHSLLAQVLASFDGVVVLSQLPPVSVASTNATIRQYNAGVAEMAGPRVRIADLYTPLSFPADYGDDVHPNQMGDDKIAGVLAGAIDGGR